MTIFPLVDDEGNTFAYAGNQRDITERRQAEEALRQSKERFDLAVRGSSDGLWDWSAASGHPVWWSPRVYELLGYEDGEIRGTYEMWIEFLHPDDRASTLEAMNANVENDMPYDVEYRLRMKSGDYKWFRSRGVTIRDENGNPIRMAGSIQDIEDRKRAEDELARHRIHLEEIVQMRTRELTEAQATLRKVHRRLLNVSEAERRHLAAELHDSVGQKLVAMALGIQQIIMGCEDPAGLEAEIQALQNMGQQCTETIQEIRTICYGLYPPMLELTGLAGSLSQLGQSCEPAVSFQLQCDDSLVETRFDPEQEIALFRMAQEAVSNALKHSEATTISISLGRQADVLTMSICDDGIGFDTTSQLGQGLGLRSMTERARAIGGTIEINSQPGRTSVEVTLPVKPPQTPD
jgi:two-component system sensor histidine kinase UhpB